MRKKELEELAAELAGKGGWTEEDGRRVLDAWGKSGKTGAEFARRLGVVPQRLFWWRRRLGYEAGEGGAAPKVVRGATAGRVELVPVTVRVRGNGDVADDEEGGRAAVVVAVGGARIAVHEVDAATAGWVAQVVTSLGERTS